MNGTNLNDLRDMSAALSQRERISITIELRNGRVLSAKYDPLLKTVTIGGATFPEGELGVWTRLCWGAKPLRIIKKSESPALPQAEN